MKLNPPVFIGGNDFFVAERWLWAMERLLRMQKCREENKVMFVVHMLRDTTLDWWTTAEATQFKNREDILWSEFKETFEDRYTPDYERTQKQKEFILITSSIPLF